MLYSAREEKTVTSVLRYFTTLAYGPEIIFHNHIKCDPLSTSTLFWVHNILILNLRVHIVKKKMVSVKDIMKPFTGFLIDFLFYL